MRFLLDTHALLWWVDAPARLRPDTHSALAEGRNEVLVSAATMWEIAIKSGLGRLTVPDDFEDEILRRGLAPLDITFEHARAVRDLPPHHSDPFDRMLVAQARVERLTLVSADPELARYDVRVLPAR